MLGEVLEESQRAFVKERQILDAMMVTSEVVDDFVSNKREGILHKLYMEKAYDYANWEFVNYMLGGLALGISGRDG